MTPQDVEIADGKAYIYGIPDEDHNCDAMDCPSICHIVAVVAVCANDGSISAPKECNRG